MKNTTAIKPSQLLLLNFLAKSLPEKDFNLCEAEISLDEIIKSLNSETNNKSKGNDGLTAEFYKHFSNEPVPVLLDVYDYWRKLSTICFTSRRGISINFL